MSNYKKLSHYELRYTDFDFKDEASPSAIFSVVQEAAGRSADELGFGYETLKAQGIGFFIVNNYCEFVRPVRLGEKLTVETWPLPPRHVFCERHTRISNEAGEALVRFAARWCLVDLQTRALLTPDSLGDVHRNCPYNTERVAETVNWRIPRLGDDGAERYRKKMLVSDCDHYFHVNNTRYADFFFDCFSMDEWQRKRVESVQIAYEKQISYGAETAFFRRDGEGESVLEARADGVLCARCRIVFAENAKTS